MDFSVNNAARSYQNVRSALQNSAAESKIDDARPAGDSGFAAANEFAAIIQKGEQSAIAQLTSGADPHAVVEAIAAAELAVETAVTVRNKVVEAYQELLRMPI